MEFSKEYIINLFSNNFSLDPKNIIVKECLLHLEADAIEVLITRNAKEFYFGTLSLYSGAFYARLFDWKDNGSDSFRVVTDDVDHNPVVFNYLNTPSDVVLKFTGYKILLQY